MTRQYWANMALCIVLGALVIFAVTRFGSMLTPKGLLVTDPQPSHEAAEILEDVVLTKYKFDEDDKHMVEADFYIQNKSDESIKNINVMCEFYDHNGKYRGRDTWLLAETVPSMHVLKLSSPSKRYVQIRDTKQNCFITDFHVVQEPLFALERHMGGGHGEPAASGHGRQPSSGH